MCVQACSDDPQVAVHAIRNLARIGFGKVSVRWSQLGFGKTSSTTPEAQTPRNLLGFKDGTRNIAGTETARLKKFVWVDGTDVDADSAWMDGGSYLVARRIRMHIEPWDRTSLQEQEDIIGRDKGEGAPVGKAKERDEPFLKAMLPDAHVRLAHPDSNHGATLLRRGYSFTDGTDGLGRLEAACSSSRTSGTSARGSSPYSAISRPTRSTSTSSTWVRRSSRSPGRPGQGRLVGPRTVH